MVGASDWRIMRSHLLPHLVAPIIVYSTLIVAQFILAEAGLSFLGLGIKLPTASWGNLLSSGAGVLHPAAVADGLARARRAARRRSPSTSSATAFATRSTRAHALTTRCSTELAQHELNVAR